jgi:hypothetical protein
MDEFDTDIFTFRRSVDTSIVDDVLITAGFHDDSFLDSVSDSDLSDVAPYIFGFQHIAFH